MYHAYGLSRQFYRVGNSAQVGSHLCYLATSIAMSVPLPMAMLTSAAASA